MKRYLLIGLCSCSWALFGQTLFEKLASADLSQENMATIPLECEEINAQIEGINARLRELVTDIRIAYENPATRFQVAALVQELSALRRERSQCQEQWQSYLPQQMTCQPWQQQQTTVGELLIEYGQRYVYIVPDEIAAFPITVASQIPVPSSCWEEMLMMILRQNGFDVVTLTPFLKQVILRREQPLTQVTITACPKELHSLPEMAPVCFVYKVQEPDPVQVYEALMQFAHPDKLDLKIAGGQIFMVGDAQAVEELLTVVEMMRECGNGREYQLLRLCHLSAKEAEKILTAYFIAASPVDGIQLRVLPLEGSLAGVFVVGTRDQIAKAQQLLSHVEQQVDDPKERVLYTYICQHAQPEEVARVLNRVYQLLLSNPLEGGGPSDAPMVEVLCEQQSNRCCNPTNVSPMTPLYTPQGPCDPGLIVSPSFNKPPSSCQWPPLESPDLGNFVVDPKSGSITMVVEREYLGRLKELLFRLDRPKKMVKIEVLLFEKKMTEEDHFGLNLLKIGSSASNTHKTGLVWNDTMKSHPFHDGILTFFMSRTKTSSGFPAFDFVYKFLLDQENIQINACPSVTTLNQTPAKIALVEEISVNNGAIIVSGCDEGLVPFVKESFTRTQYGITIEITPTIHLAQDCLEEDAGRFITLETDITFDTLHPSRDSRPDVTRRNIKNQVRIPDGQTVILGGLRRKTCHDRREAIPLVGEVPYLGKLFSEHEWHESQTEMFICLTPKIVEDEICMIEHMNLQEVCKRPGDLPCFLRVLDEARQYQKACQVTGGLKMLVRESP